MASSQPLPDLTMPHLQEARDQVKQSFDTAKDQAKALDPKEQARMQRDYTFDLDYTDGRGKRWQGSFTNQILTIGQRMRFGIVRGKRQSGVPLEVLSPLTIELVYMVGWLEESLTQRPDWAKDLMELTDVSVVQAIFGEVSLHEATFHGDRTPAENSEEKPA